MVTNRIYDIFGMTYIENELKRYKAYKKNTRISFG